MIVNKKETDEKAEIEYIRDNDGFIKYYSYTIYRQDKNPLVGKLTREEMNSIYRLYSYYGASLTQRQISRFFTDLSLIDFKRILRAFNITKASSPFAPHMIEEKSQEELMDIHLREKENDFLRRVEEERIKNTEKLLNKYAEENITLKERLETLESINVDINLEGTPNKNTSVSTNKDLILYLSDIHIGAKVDGELYENNWNEQELNNRLDSIINNVSSFGNFDTITLAMLGDHLDGMDQMTSRRDHTLPQNLNNTEQIKVFIRTICRFVNNLSAYCNSLKIFCVKCGNHAGDFEYAANLALQGVIHQIYPKVEFTLFNTFYGRFDIKDHVFLITHGKDPKYMKKPMPLNLNDSTKIKIYEYLDTNNIKGKHIHVVKGDLHTENINSCEKLDYRNVLSLFGASDYCAMNYSKNQHGISYDMFIGDNFVRGTFENL